MTELNQKWLDSLSLPMYSPNKCDLCDRNLVLEYYDARLKSGTWASLCGGCFNRHAVGLGMGKGVRLVRSTFNSPWKVVRAKI